MLTKSVVALMLVGVCVAFPSHQDPEKPHPSGPVAHGDQAHQPVPLGPQDLNQQKPHDEKSDLKTDASTWWRSWGRWGNYYGYNPVVYTKVYTPSVYTYYEPATYWTEW